MTKPPYRIPPMAEIAAVPWNGLKVVSTFSGCGGSCLGFRMAGHRVIWANEFVGSAADAYGANHRVRPDERDIREIDPIDILKTVGLEIGELDVFEGSPPCDSFSTAGKRDKGWGKEKNYSGGKTQRTDDLFFEFTRLLEGLSPRSFVAENVSGLVKGKAKGYFKIILSELKSKGYRVKARVLDAKWLGVPQSRQRVIFIGIREDLGIDPVFPTPLPYFYSVRDAIPWLAKVSRDEVENGSRMCSAYEKEWERLYPGQASDKYFNLIRSDPDRPSATVVVSSNSTGASVTHPMECRKFTIPELRRICGFPDDFRLEGTYAENWRALGMSVPPPMMRAVAETLRDQLLGIAKGR